MNFASLALLLWQAIAPQTVQSPRAELPVQLKPRTTKAPSSRVRAVVDACSDPAPSRPRPLSAMQMMMWPPS